MHLPEPTPPLRGLVLELASRLVAIPALRDWVLKTLVLKSSGVDRLPESPAGRPQ